MTDLMQKSIDTMREGVDSLKNMKEDKRKYKEYLERVKVLPDDYRFVYEKVTHYMWSLCGGGNGYDMIALQSDLLELFESSAAEGKQVLEVTGEDVAAFCDELLRNARTYTDDWRRKLNSEIINKIKKPEK